jgi:hypothetical protein
MVLAVTGCVAGRGVTVPCPQGKDWHFVCANHTYNSVSVSTTQSGTTQTTTTQTATIAHGVVRSDRKIAPVVPSPDAAALLKQQPQLANQPFLPLAELP